MTLIAQLQAAKPGDIIAPTGDLGAVFLRDLDLTGMTLDLSAATLTSLRMSNVTGAGVKGGTFRPNCWLGAIYLTGCKGISLQGFSSFDAGLWNGVTATSCTDLKVLGARIDRPKAGIALNRHDGALLQGNTILGYATDGTDLAGCRNITIEDSCYAGGLLADDHHPDAIQGWPIKGEAPPADIIIRGNLIHGRTQGIGFYDHDAGGYDRVLIEGNDIAVSYPLAIDLGGSRDSIVRNNRVRTLPGSAHRAMINTNAARSGNKVAGYLRWPSQDDPA